MYSFFFFLLLLLLLLFSVSRPDKQAKFLQHNDIQIVCKIERPRLKGTAAIKLANELLLNVGQASYSVV